METKRKYGLKSLHDAIKKARFRAELEKRTRELTWQFHALPQGGPQVSQGVCPVSEEGAVGLGASPPGSVVGGTSNGARQPYLFCPVLRRALCSGSRASCVFFAWVLWRAACSRQARRPVRGGK